MTTGSAVRDARQDAGLTQHQLAERAGVSAATVYRVEAGRHRPTRSTLRVIADALAVPVDALTVISHAPEVAKTSYRAVDKPAHGGTAGQPSPVGKPKEPTE